MVPPGPVTSDPVPVTDGVRTSRRPKFLGSLSIELPGMEVAMSHLGQLMPDGERESSCWRQPVEDERDEADIKLQFRTMDIPLVDTDILLICQQLITLQLQAQIGKYHESVCQHWHEWRYG